MNLLLLYKDFGPYPFMAIFCDDFKEFEQGITFIINNEKKSIIVDWCYYKFIDNPEQVKIYQQMFQSDL